MDINSVYGSTVGPLAESLYSQQSKTTTEENKNTTSVFGVDSVTISHEAMEKLAARTEGQTQEENAQGQDGKEAAAGAASGGGGGGAANDNDSKLQGLKAKLASLQSSLGSASGSEASAISAQIGQITAEIAALEAEAAV